MIDRRESKRRYRYDHLSGRFAGHRGKRVFVVTDASGDDVPVELAARAQKGFGPRAKQIEEIEWSGHPEPLAAAIMACIAADPEKRPATMERVLGMIAGVKL